jgi:hypothetical protein
MATIIINEHTKEGEIFIELAKLLALTDEEIIIDEESLCFHELIDTAKKEDADYNIEKSKSLTNTPNDLNESLRRD